MRKYKTPWDGHEYRTTHPNLLGVISTVALSRANTIAREIKEHKDHSSHVVDFYYAEYIVLRALAIWCGHRSGTPDPEHHPFWKPKLTRKEGGI